jgi:hypothetical protein
MYVSTLLAYIINLFEFIYIMPISLLYGLVLVCRISGVCDHLAMDDQHALQITRNIVGNLNWPAKLLPVSAHSANVYDIIVWHRKFDSMNLIV